MLPRRLLLSAVAILGAVAAAVAQQQPQPLASRSDRAGLHSLRASLGLRARDWPLKADPCTAWAGVTCRAGRVVSLTVSGLRRTRLASRAPSFSLDGLQTLTSLELFNASGFPLPGPLPPWFATALPPPLAVLDLRSASVNGTLPANLGASGNLTRLLLSGNSLSGPVPDQLLSVRTLRVLDLSANNFTGGLPNVSLAAGDGAAELFNVSGNSLYGVATYAVGALKAKFRLVDVSANYLDGIWDGSDATVDVTTNCFSGAPGQRRRADCEEFYTRQGARLVDIPAPTPSPQPQPSSDKSQKISKNLLIGIIAAAAALMALFLLALLLCYMRRRSSRSRQRGGVETNEEAARGVRRRDSSVNPVASSPVAMSPTASTTPKDTLPDFGDLSFEKLVHATGGFADDNLLKHGHSGDIYHGVLENGADIIVKKIGAKSANKNSGELDFYSRYSHQRIVPLLGHLANGDEEFLAYKYMPKADLTNALHKKPVDTEDGLPSLDWITRLKIAIGVAEAMCFLHDECSPPLVHRDIQASSVLLDDKFEVRLGSMSNICAQQSAGSQNVFTRILRSSKSLDKNASVPPATSSYDVYCFGKVILELVTGNFGVSGSNNAGSEEWLANTTNRISVNDKDSITNIIDPLLIVDEDHLEEVWAVAIVAKTCLNSKPSRRPSARYVLKALENPLRVVRAGSRSNSARLRSSSSRSSWQSAFVQGNRYQSYEIMSASGRMLDRRGSVRSHISGGEASSSFKRSLREIAPDPQVLDEDVVV
ncbi:probable LRR receptor-like serine/threonine-protein kinase At2g16250 [Lolium rigidum]|uniref:probable LRR receptor-like serine/threonine-protein kinase At2g16250 n=1 Tax=Lolium rigidum TaxID=89674 RepID=UPI001F5C5324|nr:probable LRR receptor-like serine/threonine-protein kinase At2g16250 [Lolium rigidum]